MSVVNSNNLKDEFLELISLNQGIIFKICNIYTNNREDFNDLKQEIILQLWKSIPNFKGNSKFTTWMYRVAFNTAISNIRKSKKHPIFHVFSNLEYSIPDREEVSYLTDEINQLYNAISELNDIDKAIIMLYLDKKTYNEIGQIVGFSEKNISVKLVRIKNKLKAILKR
jgi:RNA polymerase sigma-70 factor (ECF subfamily)